MDCAQIILARFLMSSAPHPHLSQAAVYEEGQQAVLQVSGSVVFGRRAAVFHCTYRSRQGACGELEPLEHVEHALVVQRLSFGFLEQHLREREQHRSFFDDLKEQGRHQRGRTSKRKMRAKQEKKI